MGAAHLLSAGAVQGSLRAKDGPKCPTGLPHSAPHQALVPSPCWWDPSQPLLVVANAFPGPVLVFPLEWTRSHPLLQPLWTSQPTLCWCYLPPSFNEDQELVSPGMRRWQPAGSGWGISLGPGAPFYSQGGLGSSCLSQGTFSHPGLELSLLPLGLSRGQIPAALSLASLSSGPGEGETLQWGGEEIAALG